jgi:hypothetical protein
VNMKGTLIFSRWVIPIVFGFVQIRNKF